MENPQLLWNRRSIQIYINYLPKTSHPLLSTESSLLIHETSTSTLLWGERVWILDGGVTLFKIKKSKSQSFSFVWCENLFINASRARWREPKPKCVFFIFYFFLVHVFIFRLLVLSSGSAVLKRKFFPFFVLFYFSLLVFLCLVSVRFYREH